MAGPTAPTALSVFSHPYRELLPANAGRPLRNDLRGQAGAALVWCLGHPDDWAPSFDCVRTRPGGVSLIAVLPEADDVTADPEILRVVELCRPQSILPFHPEPHPDDLRALLKRPPEDLAVEVTDYLAWRGLVLDPDTRHLVRRILELSGELRTVSALSRSLYLSRRALGRRLLEQRLPVASHWLHFGRLLRAAVRMQNSKQSLVGVAWELGYPDGFALSNQMKRLTGVRPTTARERLGWEWIVEAWLRKEAEEGNLDPGFRHPPSGAPADPPSMARTRTREESRRTS